MSLSWLRQGVKNTFSTGGRKTCRIKHQRRCRVHLGIESLEDRCLPCAGMGSVHNGLQLFNDVVKIASEANTLNKGPDPMKVTNPNAWYYAHGAYLLTDEMGLAGHMVGTLGQKTAGRIINDTSSTISSISHLAYDWTTGRSKGQKVWDAGTSLTHLGSEILGLAGGTVPGIVGDSLDLLKPTGDLLHALVPSTGNPIDWAKALESVPDLASGIVGLLNDVLGCPKAKQPLQVSVGGVGPYGILVLSEMTQGANYVGPVASFSDPNVTKASPGDYKAIINWGDGSSSAGQIDSNLDVLGAHTYTRAGDYSLSVLVTGDGTQGQGTAEATVKSNLSNVFGGAGFTVAAGQTIANGQVAAFNTWAFGSQDQRDYSAAINWGDGVTSPGQVVYGGSAGFGVQGSHTYTQPGTYTITTQINAPNGETSSATTEALVLSPEQATVVASTPQNISPTVGQPFTGTVAGFTDFDGDSNPSDFQATIDWGDGATSPAQLVAAANGSINVIGSHTYMQIGQDEMVVNVTDNADGGGTSVLPTATVGPFHLAANNVSVAAGQTFSGTLATLTAPPGTNVNDYTATIFWGDSPLYAPAGGAPAGQIVANGDGAFSILSSHTYPGAGTYSIRLAVQGPNGVWLYSDSTATVGSGGLAVTAQNLSIKPSPSANSSTASARTADTTSGGSVNGTVAAFTAPPGANAGDYTATIDWGDGYTSTGQIVANADGAFNVLGSHTYSQIAGYLTSVQVSDNNGNIASAFGTVSPPPPTSSVNPLPAAEASPSFTVSWSGSDPGGPGIASYNVYVSDNGGPFTPWLTNTTQTSATFNGQAGHSYGFYSVAIDANGLQQPAPTAAQAATTIPMPGNNNPGNSNPGNNNPGNHPIEHPHPAPPDVPFLLVWFNKLLGDTETVSDNGTTITDRLFGLPLVETYDFSGSLVSVTLLGFDITFLF
jgi:hypothetical protein